MAAAGCGTGVSPACCSALVMLRHRLSGNRRLLALLRAIVADGGLDRVFREYGAVNLNRRQAELVHDIGVLDFESLIYCLALQPLCRERGAGNSAATAKRLELGVLYDAAGFVYFDLQLHYVAAF